jgi:tetratricopeptide (TPR) repeat protein
MDLPESELLSHLSVLKDSELLYERGIYPKLTYVFNHALTYDTAYNSLLLKKTKEVHERIGKAIEELYSDRLAEFYEILAYHYSRSDDQENAYQYLKLSGGKATRNYSTWEAFRFYKEAIQVIKKMPETEQTQGEMLEVYQLILGPMRLLSYPEDSLQMIQEGEKLAKHFGNEKIHAMFYSRLGNYYSIKGGNPLLGIEYSEKSFLKAQAMQDSELIARTGWDLTASYIMSGQFLKVGDVAPTVFALLEKTKKEHESFGVGMNAYAALHGYYGWSMAWLGSFEEGRFLLEKGFGFASEINDKTSVGIVDWFSGMAFAIKGEGPNAIEHSQNAVKYFEEAKWGSLLGHAWSELGWGHLLKGEVETARQCVEKGLKIYTDAGSTWYFAFPFWVLGMVHLASGDLTNAQNCIEESLRLSIDNKERHFEALARLWLGKILIGMSVSKSKQGEEEISQGIKALDELRLKPFSAIGYMFLGELHLLTGNQDKALKNLQRAEEMLQKMEMDYWLGKTREILERL